MQQQVLKCFVSLFCMTILHSTHSIWSLCLPPSIFIHYLSCTIPSLFLASFSLFFTLPSPCRPFSLSLASRSFTSSLSRTSFSFSFWRGVYQLWLWRVAGSLALSSLGLSVCLSPSQTYSSGRISKRECSVSGTRRRRRLASWPAWSRGGRANGSAQLGLYR